MNCNLVFLMGIKLRSDKNDSTLMGKDVGNRDRSRKIKKKKKKGQIVSVTIKPLGK